MARWDPVDAVIRNPVFEGIARVGIVPVITLDRVGDADRLAGTLLDSGLPCVEITFRTEAAVDAIALISHRHPDMLVGAGTVLTLEQAAAAVESGARFLAAPGFDDEVVEWCLASAVPVIPGVMTPTEVGRGARAGLTLLKFFPANTSGGPQALVSIGAVFPRIDFVPTGGVGPGNLADYLNLSNVSACGASWVAPRQLIIDGDYTEIARRSAEAVAIVARTRPAGPREQISR